MNFRTLPFSLAALLLVFQPSVSDGEILIDFSHDTANFFDGTPAQFALEAAVSDINDLIDFNLSAINLGDDEVTGSNGSIDATFSFDFNYINPSTGAVETIDAIPLDTDEVRLFVGTRPLSGPTLGVGGPGSVGSFRLRPTAGSPVDWPGAVGNASDLANIIYDRGESPLISNVAGSSDFAGNIGNYDIDFAMTHGSVAFDPTKAWHFNHLEPVADNTNDFYSVALHEILHALGVGSSDTWDSLVSGTDWLGSEAILVNGTGIGLIDGGGAHLVAGVQSKRLFDGGSQEAVMDPNLTAGTRKYLTQLDAAVLRDLGYSTVVIPEPSGLLAFTLIIGVSGLRRRR